MVSIERTSKSEQTLKHYGLKIIRLQDTERKKLSNQGFMSVFNLCISSTFYIFNNKIDLLQALRRCVLLFERVTNTP